MIKKGLVLGAVVLAGCGFHVRGSHGTWGPLPPVALEGTPALKAEMRHMLVASGTLLVKDRKQAKLIIRCTEEHVEQRVLSVNATAVAEEFEMHYTATYSMEDGHGKVLIAPETVEQIRVFPFSDVEVLGATGEQQYLMTDMRHHAVEQMLRRVEQVAHAASARTP